MEGAQSAGVYQTNLDPQLLLDALTKLKNGDLSASLPAGLGGIDESISAVFNDMVQSGGIVAKELDEVAAKIGREGDFSMRVNLPNVPGLWKPTVDSFNNVLSDLIQPTQEMVRIISAVADGDLSQSIHPDFNHAQLQGEYLRMTNEVRRMLDNLNKCSEEITRVIRDVGIEGRLGVKANISQTEGIIAGTWKDLTDNVNTMADNLTGQVRAIAEVTTAVAKGDLSRKMTIETKGEILELKNTINTMVDQLNSFASEVTRVAREVGTEGKLGGQAQVEGVAGTWKDLTENVNTMAANLTGQVRAIAEVTTAVASGDLSKKIQVDVKGDF